MCAPIVTLLSSFGTLIGIGGSILFSLRLGQKNKEQAKQILGSCFTLLVGFSAVLTILALLFKNQLLWWFWRQCGHFLLCRYLSYHLYLWHLFCPHGHWHELFHHCPGISGLGMTTTLIGAILNIFLDPLFMFGFHMGIAGAAIATVLSQMASCAFVLLVLFRKNMPVLLKPCAPQKN